MKKEAAQSQDLVVIEKASILTVFTTEGAMEPHLKKVREWIDDLPAPDISTEKGRSAIISNAVKVRDIKIYLESLGKDLAADQKKIPALIDKTRRENDAKLSEWQAEVRKPVTDWEAAETARTSAHQHAIQGFYDLGRDLHGLTLEQLRDRLAELKNAELGAKWQEFEPAANKAVRDTIVVLSGVIEREEAHEAGQAELARFRAEQAEREAKQKVEAGRIAQEERDEQIRQEAVQQAQLEAEAERQVEAYRIAEELKAAAAREAEHKQALERAEQARVAAENAAKETEARIKREQEEAAKREADELARREANKKHAAKIHNEALEAFVKGGISEDFARQVVTLIAKKEIPHVGIAY